MEFKYVETDEPMLYDNHYELQNSLGIEINIQVCEDVVFKNDNYVINKHYIVNKYNNESCTEHGTFSSLKKAKSVAKNLLMNIAFGEDFMKSKNKGSLQEY